MLYIKHRDEKDAASIAEKYALRLREMLGDRVLGPAKPPVSRIANFFIQTLMLKIEAHASMVKVKNMLRAVYADLSTETEMRSMQIYYDVDPA